MGEERGSMLGNVFHNCLTLCRGEGVTAKISSYKYDARPFKFAHLRHRERENCLVLELAKDLTGTD